MGRLYPRKRDPCCTPLHSKMRRKGLTDVRRLPFPNILARGVRRSAARFQTMRIRIGLSAKYISGACSILRSPERPDTGRQRHGRSTRFPTMLAAADGQGTTEITWRTGMSKPTVRRWRERQLVAGLPGIERDEMRSPRGPASTGKLRIEAIAKTGQETPANEAQWNRATGGGDGHCPAWAGHGPRGETASGLPCRLPSVQPCGARRRRRRSGPA